MITKECKVTQHTSDTVRITAPDGWHFVRLIDNENLGNKIYDSIHIKLDTKYRLEIDNYLTTNIL